ncbi:cobalt transporter subunit CbtA [Polaromonas sp. YR568]|uniref:CbtA family protein n=1 Tax=Polaromonas sp. YR568 TaxID=1855301 RepID=UPI0008E0CB73|nr:CbtA family protein [Polaromonas sp. YR568]SFU52265.1 cobalt transporter subunit CbtA [Polaromonas sp. YR568]
MIFQRLIWAALAVAVVVGSVQSGVQQLQAVPIILAAEVYESQKVEAPAAAAAPAAAHTHTDGAAHTHAGEAAKEWEPADGAERIFWTWVANVLHAFSMALLVFVVMGFSLARGSNLRSLTLAAWVAAAGWLTFHFWPSLGLHAEIPGMDAARLGSRQGWWVLAAASAALACGSLAMLRNPWRWAAAAAWLAVPYVVGAPHIATDPLAGFSGEAQTALRQLGTQFIWATTWVSLSFWVCMGLAGGWAFQRWVRPALLAVLQRSEAPVAGAVQAPQ